MAALMATHGLFSETFDPLVGRIEETVDVEHPEDTILLCRNDHIPQCNFSDFAAVLVENGNIQPFGRLGVFKSLAHLERGDLVALDGTSGRLRTLYRTRSPHNALFVTDHCNNNCIMCSQPPKNDIEHRLGVCFRVIELLKSTPPAHLGITGGEPTLLGDEFIKLLLKLKEVLPDTTLTTLTNGRNFADPDFVRAIAAVDHPKLRFTIPLHADVPDIHDYIAQAKGAFSDTIEGLYNLASYNIEAELRVVLHAQSVPRLYAVAEFVWRKLPFVHQVAFMGLENMGYVKKNVHQLWIDPIDYSAQLLKAVSYLWRRGMMPAIYNLPLCVLPETLWDFARQSISDHKQTLIPECEGCTVSQYCAGFFTSGTEHHSRGIKPLHIEVSPIKLMEQ